MRYLAILLLLLSGCAVNMTGFSRSTDETMDIAFYSNFIRSQITAVAGDESFRGKVVSTGNKTISDSNGNKATISGNTYRAFFIGDKGRTIRCEFCGGYSEGVGTCITSDGEEFDVMW